MEEAFDPDKARETLKLMDADIAERKEALGALNEARQELAIKLFKHESGLTEGMVLTFTRGRKQTFKISQIDMRFGYHPVVFGYKKLASGEFSEHARRVYEITSRFKVSDLDPENVKADAEKMRKLENEILNNPDSL